MRGVTGRDRYLATSFSMTTYGLCSFLAAASGHGGSGQGCNNNVRILLANSNQWYFNSLVKKPCHKTHGRCPHRLNLSFQSSRSCAGPNIRVLKDKDLECANSIRPFFCDFSGVNVCIFGNPTTSL